MTQETGRAVTELDSALDRALDSVHADVLKLRRHIHRHPEVGWTERATQAHLRAWLEARGLNPVDCAETGLYCDIGEGAWAVLYRGDIDALPIQDGKELGRAACVSQNPGISHACGHDVHSAIAAGLAAGLCQIKHALPGRVRVLFQPAEEVLPSGGARVVSEGIIDNCRAALAVHCDPTRDRGTVGLRTGVLTATSDKFVIEIHGTKGHSARPHLAADAILASADVVRSLYTLVGQRVDPLEPAVLNVGQISGGEVENVIAGRVELRGVVRTMHTDVRDRLHHAIRSVSEAAAHINGCTANVAFDLGAPPIFNDARLHGVVERAAADVLGRAGIQLIDTPSTGAEDFGNFAVRTPIYMMRLGVRTPNGPTLHLHTPTFEVDEGCVQVGLKVMGRAIVRAIEAMPAEGAED